MTTLALDLGTTTGFCVGDRRDALLSGTWVFKPQRFESGGMRYVRFRRQLDELRVTMQLSQIYFEEVRAHKGVDAAHVYGGLMATLMAWCEDNAMPCQGVPVGTIKKYATGKGNAPKAAMIKVVQARGFDVIDHNHADAIALWLSQEVLK